MIKINKDIVIRLHELMCDSIGGGRGIRDEGLIESAVLSAYQTFGGIELYPTDIEKICRIGYALISNHAFVDGNKRIGILLALTLFRINGITICTTSADIVALGIGVASGALGYEDMLLWTKERI